MMSSSVKLHYILRFRLDVHLNVFFLVLLTLSDMCLHKYFRAVLHLCK